MITGPPLTHVDFHPWFFVFLHFFRWRCQMKTSPSTPTYLPRWTSWWLWSTASLVSKGHPSVFTAICWERIRKSKSDGLEITDQQSWCRIGCRCSLASDDWLVVEVLTVPMQWAVQCLYTFSAKKHLKHCILVKSSDTPCSVFRGICIPC